MYYHDTAESDIISFLHIFYNVSLVLSVKSPPLIQDSNHRQNHYTQLKKKTKSMQQNHLTLHLNELLLTFTKVDF